MAQVRFNLRPNQNKEPQKALETLILGLDFVFENQMEKDFYIEMYVYLFGNDIIYK